MVRVAAAPADRNGNAAPKSEASDHMMPGSPGAHPDPRVFIPVTAAGHPAPALRTFPVMSLPSLPEGLTYVLTTRSALVDLTPKLKVPHFSR